MGWPGWPTGSFAGGCLLVALAVLALGCGGGAKEPAQLVFQSERDGDFDVYVMDADGGDVRQLTNEPGKDYEADGSPDGRRLVFVSDRVGGDDTQLYLMNPDGSDVRRLTFSARADALVVDDYPHWSPDGRLIVFQRTTFPAGGRLDADVWLIDPATGEETRLTEDPEAFDSTPSFSADGQSVLFERDRGGEVDIYRLDIEGGAMARLTDSPGKDIQAKESPDGKRIAFASDRDGEFEVYVMRWDGSDVRQLTQNEEADRCPHWSPDGRLLSFFSDRDGDREIYVMRPDGSGQRRLTESPGRDEVPNWLE